MNSTPGISNGNFVLSNINWQFLPRLNQNDSANSRDNDSSSPSVDPFTAYRAMQKNSQINLFLQFYFCLAQFLIYSITFALILQKQGQHLNDGVRKLLYVFEYDLGCYLVIVMFLAFVDKNIIGEYLAGQVQNIVQEVNLLFLIVLSHKMLL